mgnify:CR=1 FL=1|jgi:hypothetical protein
MKTMTTLKQELRESKVKKYIPEAVFVDGRLVSPLPTIKVGHRIVQYPNYIEMAFIRYDFKTVIEAMKNKKIILNL